MTAASLSKESRWIRLKRRLSLTFGLDLRSLAFARIFISAIVIGDLIDRSLTLTRDYTDAGDLPRSAIVWASSNTWRFSLHFLNGTTAFQVALFIIAGVFAVMMLVGWRTRLATIASWLMLISLQNRNPIILQGGDVLIRVALFFAIFLPWGTYFSVDAARAKVKGEPGPKSPLLISGATVAFLLQIAFVYWFTAILKVQSPEWTTQGTAIYYTLRVMQFATPFGQFLLKFPAFLHYMTSGVILTEALAPFLFFIPFASEAFRLVGALIFISFHLGLNESLRLGPFPWIGIGTGIALLPGLFWRTLDRWFAKRTAAHVTIYYDNNCGFCKKTVDRLGVFLILNHATVRAAMEDPSIFSDMTERNSWIVVDAAGTRHYKFDGLVTVFRASPIMMWVAPLFAISFVRTIGDKMYRWVAEHRLTVCDPDEAAAKKLTAIAAPGTKFSRMLSITGKILLNGVPLALIIYIFFWNLMQVAPQAYTMPASLQNVGYLLNIDQRWDMFSPPLRDDGWYVMPGRLADGAIVDIFRNGAPLDWAEPATPVAVANLYTGERQRKYLMNLWDADYSQYRSYYAQYLCRTWNASHPASEALENFDIVFMLTETEPNYQTSTPQPTLTWRQYCFSAVIPPTDDSALRPPQGWAAN